MSTTDRFGIRRMASQLFSAGLRSCEAAALLGWLTPRNPIDVQAVDALLLKLWIVTEGDDKDVLPYTERTA